MTSTPIDQQSIQNFFKWAEIEQDGLIEWQQLRYDDTKYHQVDAGFTGNPRAVPYPDPHSLLVVGINPRPHSQIKSAHDADIHVYKNLYIDIEPIHPAGTNVSEEELIDCKNFVDAICDRELPDMGIIACSGNGYHICVAIPAYDKPQEFANKLQVWYKTVLLPHTEGQRKTYHIRIDSTFSPSRKVKLYGTKKPIEGSRLSSFPSTPRLEDVSFRDYILSFPEKPRTTLSVDLSLRGSSATLEAIEQKYGFVR
jgi:hypothetical protein